LDKDGNLYSWGTNSYGQLGLGQSNNNSKRALPSKISFSEKITNIFAGEDHCGFVTLSGEAFLMGYGLV